MKKMLMKVICVLSFIGYAGIVSAQCDTCCQPPQKPVCEPCKACEICPPCEPCKPCCTEVPKTGEPCNCAYNAPARIDPACGWDSWLSVSFIYWQAKEKGLEVGDHIYTKELTNETIRHIDTINMNFDYIPGFKVGAGYSFCRDDWTVYLEYTRLNGSNSSTKDIKNSFGENNFLVSFLNTDPKGGYAYYNLSSEWTLDYNVFDLELGRPYYLGKKLVFKPHFGLRAGWIDQCYDQDGFYISKEGESTIYIYNKQDSWMIGPRTGLDTDWMIGCDFRIFGNVAGSLVYQDFDISSQIVEPDITFARSNEVSYITPNVEFALGLGYGSYFFNNEWYFDLAVGYDFNYFWNQNMMKYYDDSAVYSVDGDSGNLYLHGLTVTARVDF